MTKTKRILAGTIGVLALVGGLVFLTPYGSVLAKDATAPRAPGWMMGGY